MEVDFQCTDRIQVLQIKNTHNQDANDLYVTMAHRKNASVIAIFDCSGAKHVSVLVSNDSSTWETLWNNVLLPDASNQGCDVEVSSQIKSVKLDKQWASFQR